MSQPTNDRDDLLLRLAPITGQSQARRLLNRAARLAGIGRRQQLSLDDLLRVCAALSIEGGPVQRIAEDLARESLGAPPRLHPD